MNWLQTIIVLLIAYVAVFAETSIGMFRNLTGAQIHLLPALMVYASLTGGLGQIALLAVAGGLWFDSLSANPLGTSILPLFVVGVVIWRKRALLLREQVFAQFVLGAGASAAVPAISVLILVSMGSEPLLGWASLWQWFVVSLAGGIVTPLLFGALDRIHRALSYQSLAESSFRADREIKRGRF
jgi:rod shape-determining protein MreD